MMRFCSLGSGSSGNATLIEASAGITTTRVLVDCGFSLRELERRLAADPAVVGVTFADRLPLTYLFEPRAADDGERGELECAERRKAGADRGVVGEKPPARALA